MVTRLLTQFPSQPSISHNAIQSNLELISFVFWVTPQLIITRFYSDETLIFSIFNMNMRQIVLLITEQVHFDKNAIKHLDNSHSFIL